MALAMLTVLLPRSFHQKSARVVWTVSGNAHVNSAWSVFCAALALHSLRVWSIEWWQIGFRGMIALALRHLIAVACGLPCLRNIVQREVRKELASVESKMHGQGDSQALVKLPQEAWSCSRIWQQIQRFQAAEASVYVGIAKKWAGIYHAPEGDLVNLQNKVWSLYNCSNTLYEGVFPSVRKFEAELISWILHMLHAGTSSCGLLTSGGTESVLLAALAYRELGHRRGIATPRILAANTCHPCIVKACHYFGLKLTKIPVHASSGFALTAAAVKSHITGDVICIYASAPSFPHGVIDQIEDLGQLASSHGIGLHVDNCLGGILLSFLDAQDLPTHQRWDFRAEGVTSISVDVHKYGNASKGVSVVCFRDPELRRLTYVPVTDGCEGLYVTPTMQGARGGAIIAQAWATMLSFGNHGYERFAAEIHRSHLRCQEIVNSIPGLFVLCKCHACIVPVGSKKYDIYAVASVLEEKGWNLATGQNPPYLGICIGERHSQILDEFEQDLRSAIAYLDENPGHKPTGAAAVYGAMSTTPTAILEEVVKRYVDMRLWVKPLQVDTDL
ncbi:unnamed protein product [Durusdinium trenchii]|uniref:sphinganine-1-phosphate aldolase n=1 Tax=Durusdinium trenchii TaxID=1381693 RepID=A0ABP0JGI5_9DINO